MALLSERVKRQLPFFLLLIALVAVVWRYFKEIIKAPDQYLFSLGGDAIKGYYSALWYLKYDKDFRFTGMNYPFGESLLYPDVQPFLIECLRIYQQHFSPLPYFGLGVINVVLVLSPVITGVVLYAILQQLRLPRGYSAVTALIITFLSPQFLRYTDQLSLSYTFIVPLMWLLIIRLFATRHLLYMGLYVGYVLLLGFFHPYLVAIGTIFLLAYLLVYWLQHLQSSRAQWKFLVAVFATAVLPVMLFNLIVLLTDPIRDRPTDPYGFFAYFSNFSSVFFPVVSPLKDVFQQLFKTQEPVWEGYAYVGTAGLLCFIFTSWKFINYLARPSGRNKTIRKRLARIVRPVLPDMLRTGLWAGILVLLFSFCIPFKIDGFKWIPDLIPPLKQFRALGRFTWIFFYIFTVYSAYYFYLLYRYLAFRNAKSVGLGLLVLVFFAWAVDAKVTVKVPSDALNARREAHRFIGDEGNYKELLTKNQRSPEEFQAILPLPFYHIGSEAFWIDGTPRVLGESMKASLNTGLPISAVMMARTSLHQTLDLMKLIGNPVLDRPLLKRLPSEKPFLVLFSKEELTENEQALLNKATKIAETEYTALYALPVSAFANTASQEIARFEQRRDSLVQQNDLLLSENRTDVVFEKYTKEFRSDATDKSFLDPGSVWSKKKPLVLFNGMMPNADYSTDYELSVWYNFEGGKAPELFIRQYDPQGNELWMTPIAVKRATDLYGNWVRASGVFKLHGSATRLEVTLNGKNMTVDNLLIKPKQLDVYYQSPELKMVVWNNFPLKPGL